MKNTMTKILVSSMFVAVLGMVWLAVPEIATVAEAQSGASYSQITVQNMDEFAMMHLRVSYYNVNGSLALTTTHTVPPYGSRSITLNQPNQAGLPVGFSGSAILDADKPFAYFVTEYNGVTNTMGISFWSEAYSGVSAPLNDTVSLFPQLLKDYSGAVLYNSRLFFQNPNLSAVTVTIKYKQNTGAEYTHSGIVIASGGLYSVTLHDDSVLSGVTPFVGSARVTSTQPIVTLAHKTTISPVMSYTGLYSSTAATTLYAVPLYKNISGGPDFTWGSALVAMTGDGTSANVTLSYYDKDSGYKGSESPVVANPTASLDVRSSGVMSTLYGYGILTATKSIVASINLQTNYDTDLGMRACSYRAFPASAGKTKLFLPVIWKYATDPATGVEWSTGVNGVLVGDTATTVTLTYYMPNGTMLSQMASVTPSARMFAIDPRLFSDLPSGTVASGVLTTNPPQPIVAVVGFGTAATTRGDPAMCYEGMGQ